MKPLEGRIALVAGATRGAGRGIATMLGEAGATVYCTGRSSRTRPGTGLNRPETIEETAEMVDARGGKGIPVRVDHSVEEEVVALCERIRQEQGRLDILINDIWGGEQLVEFGTPFWKQSAAKGQLMFERGVFTHLLTARHAVPLMVEKNQGLIVEVTDGNMFGYRGSLWYDLVKMTIIRLAFDMSRELRRTKVTALAITPGFLRSEEMLAHFGVTEANWRDGAKKDANFIASETPYFVGRAVAALAADPHVHTRAGRAFSSWDLSREYGFTDIDGSSPHWGEHFARTYGRPYPIADDAAYASWLDSPIEITNPDWFSF
jgi:NAD(P)-dependent dehydrogenase (short-subunit alcohol dehydrogenase family)